MTYRELYEQVQKELKKLPQPQLTEADIKAIGKWQEEYINEFYNGTDNYCKGT